MRKRTLFSSLMLPSLLALLLLPPLSCIIFQHTATERAYSDAALNLEMLNQSILPMIETTFQSTEQSDEQEAVRSFLRNVSLTAQKAKGNVIILESRLRVVYPHDEQERAEIEDFSEICIEHIPDEDEKVIELMDTDGEKYLVQYYRLPTESVRVRYLIAYSSVSQLNEWVTAASVQTLIISACFVVLISIVLFLAIRSVSKPLRQLAKGVTTIGDGNFMLIEQPFKLRELEDVRLATNRMSQRLQKAEKTQKDFLQNVSHELRNPLMSISGYAQGIERGVFSSPESAAHTILEESKRLADLVGELLTLSRLENDNQPVLLEKLPVAETIQDCMDRINGIAVQRQISLVLEPAPCDVLALVNEELLSQIMDNLLSNAIRYAKSAVTITVNAVPGSVFINVLDDGNGIAQNDLPHLFERCYKGKGGHFGIGLAIAASAAEKMKSSLSAANLENGGASFTLQLPSV